MMRAFVVYDSVHGNTEIIAQTIGKALVNEMTVEVARADEVSTEQLNNVDLIVIGSPTHGGWFTEAVKEFLNNTMKLAKQDFKIAVFDTRTPPVLIHKVFGYAANKTRKTLNKQGREIILEPEGFIVDGLKGPLSEGEEKRAEKWAECILAKK